jgi:TatD DNase family protein
MGSSICQRRATSVRVGLDAGPQFYKSLEAQTQVFRKILERCADAGGKVLTVHSVRSVPAVLDLIESHLPQDRGLVVLHWFTGTMTEARRATALGCYFSINAEMIRSDRGRALISDLPVESHPHRDGRPIHED